MFFLLCESLLKQQMQMTKMLMSSITMNTRPTPTPMVMINALLAEEGVAVAAVAVMEKARHGYTHNSLYQQSIDLELIGH